MVRVIAGRYRSRRLKTLAGQRTRPTSDRLRETLFNVLGAAVEGCLFADCYAGSGAVGIEALSRGAQKAYFLESNPQAVQIIRANMKALGIEYKVEAEVFSMAVTTALKKLAHRGVKFDIAFLDPPYDAVEEYTRSLEWFGAGSLLAPEAIVVAEHDKRLALADCYGSLRCTRTLRQGDAVLSFYQVGAGAPKAETW
jgi:16S rRNA (guanine(966)-N(2))-methyltransferase RsmD